jgi:hypothetical protein
MARSIETIYNSIVAEKETFPQLNELAPPNDTAQTLLDDVQSPSKVADWRLWCWVVAVCTWVLETLFDRHKAELEVIAAAAVAGTLPWYGATTLEWQYGDLQVWNDQAKRWEYPVINLANRLAKRSSARAGNGVIFIKAAKEGAMTPLGPELEPLTPAEYISLTAFWEQNRFAGDILSITSLNPDGITGAIDVYYDAVLDVPTLTDNLQLAAAKYLAAIPFDGTFVKDSLVDALQKVPGVRYTQVQSLNGIAGASSTPITTTYEAASGYFAVANTQGTVFTFNLIPA